MADEYFYSTAFNGSTMYNAGKSANPDDFDGMIILHFFSPQKSGGVYGASCGDGLYGFKTNPEIAAAVQSFIVGYNRTPSYTRMAMLR